MSLDIIKEKTDLTYLKWSHIRGSSGTAGTFLKSQSSINGVKRYYKLSNFDMEKGVIGHECINEIIVARLLTILGVEHLEYKLINADISVDGRIYNTYLCASEDFKERGESKVALDDYFRVNQVKGESRYDFCVRNGWKDYIDRMIAIDFIILNRDRHGANIEILRNSRAHTFRPAPLFDHGLSLLYSCNSEEDVKKFDVMDDKACQNFIGSRSCFDNLQLIKGLGEVFPNRLNKSDKAYLFEGLEDILPSIYLDKIWKMISKRYKVYEDIRDNK
ncbi:MAG: hypothetical protein J5517_09680 [Eubacterium sp.]|nr:hypothetical protein [Eubacterium sp.]